MGRNKGNQSNKYKNKKSTPKKESFTNKEAKSEWDQHFFLFQNQVLKLSLYLRDIIGDGNCLFRATCDQLEGSQSNYKFYRDLTCSYLSENQQFFAPFLPEDLSFEKYLKIISKDGVWGGNLELQALSKALGVNFVLHMLDRPPIIMNNIHDEETKDENGKCKCLHLAYHFGEKIGEHYSSVRNIDEKDSILPAKRINIDLLLKKEENAGEFCQEFGKENEKNYFNEEDKEIEEICEKVDLIEIKENNNHKDYPRNKKCFCGSKKAYKNCCINKPKDKKEEDSEKKTKNTVILV